MRRSSHFGVGAAGHGRRLVEHARHRDDLAGHAGAVTLGRHLLHVADQEARQLRRRARCRCDRAVEHGGRRDARAQRGDGDAGVAQFLGQRFGQRQHVGLAGRVGRQAGHGLEGRDRRDVEHASVAAPDHRGHEGGQHRGQARDVEVDQLLAALRAHADERALLQHAGVVDEHVDRAPPAPQRRGQRRRRTRLRQVGGQHVDARAVLVAQAPSPARAASASRRATSTRRWPSRAKQCASASPIPDDAPVTSTVDGEAGAARAWRSVSWRRSCRRPSDRGLLALSRRGMIRIVASRLDGDQCPPLGDGVAHGRLWHPAARNRADAAKDLVVAPTRRTTGPPDGHARNARRQAPPAAPADRAARLPRDGRAAVAPAAARVAPRGDGHPVLLLPGFMGTRGR